MNQHPAHGAPKTELSAGDATSAMQALLEGFQHGLNQRRVTEVLAFPRIKTGRAAQQSAADLWKRQQVKPDEERFLPVGNRAARRQAQQEAARIQRRGQRAWNRRQRELAKAGVSA